MINDLPTVLPLASTPLAHTPTDRAAVYLNMAAFLNVDPISAAKIVFYSIDVDDEGSMPEGINHATYRVLHMLALASYSSDDDFDEFVSELDELNR